MALNPTALDFDPPKEPQTTKFFVAVVAGGRWQGSLGVLAASSGCGPGWRYEAWKQEEQMGFLTMNNQIS